MPSRMGAVESVVMLVVGTFIGGMIFGVIVGSLWALVAPAIVGILYLLVVLPSIDAVTEQCDGWCASQTWSASLIRFVFAIFILAFGILPGMGGAAVGIWLREKIDDQT